MAMDPAQLLHDALQLSEQDRAMLAGRLLESLDPEHDEGVEPGWAKEIEQRLREIDEGIVKAVPWEEARRMIRES
jgi:putative addiction module component (TIGR02574 family)